MWYNICINCYVWYQVFWLRILDFDFYNESGKVFQSSVFSGSDSLIIRKSKIINVVSINLYIISVVSINIFCDYFLGNNSLPYP